MKSGVEGVDDGTCLPLLFMCSVRCNPDAVQRPMCVTDWFCEIFGGFFNICMPQ